LYRIYGYVFRALAIYTIGFIIFVMFDTNDNSFWSSYWDVIKIVMIALLIPPVIIFCSYFYRNSRIFRH
jgi:hypothetical protein